MLKKQQSILQFLRVLQYKNTIINTCWKEALLQSQQTFLLALIMLLPNSLVILGFVCLFFVKNSGQSLS